MIKCAVCHQAVYDGGMTAPYWDLRLRDGRDQVMASGFACSSVCVRKLIAQLLRQEIDG